MYKLSKQKEIKMDIHVATETAKRMRSLVRRSEMFGKSREDIIEEIMMIAEDYDAIADRLDQSMAQECEVA